MKLSVIGKWIWEARDVRGDFYYKVKEDYGGVEPICEVPQSTEFLLALLKLVPRNRSRFVQE